MNEIILAVIAAILGGCNIFQFLFLRDTKRRYAAEASEAATAAKHSQVDLQQDQFDYVNTQLSKIQKEYYELAANYRDTMTKHLQEIDNKCNEIAELKSKLTYFKGLRCYCSDCDKRVREGPYKNNKQE